MLCGKRYWHMFLKYSKYVAKVRTHIIVFVAKQSRKNGCSILKNGGTYLKLSQTYKGFHSSAVMPLFLYLCSFHGFNHTSLQL
jgi:hypothetical protein